MTPPTDQHVDWLDDEDFAPVEVPAQLPPDSPRRRAPNDERRRRPDGRLRRWSRVAGRVGAVALAVVVVCVSCSLIGAAKTPGNEAFKAKWADWLRNNHAGFLVQRFENAYFRHKQPPKGGTVKRLHMLPKASDQVTTSTTPTSASTVTSPPTTTLPAHLAAPPPVPLVVQPAAPHEGQWQPTGPLVHGLPMMRVAQFRADSVYSSQLASAVWIDTKLARVHFMPGSQEPGNLPPPYAISGPALPKIAAAFNGGFRFKDARGGVYFDGRAAVPLVDGAASIVIHTDGRVEIGSWNDEVHLSSSVEAVLQNLQLMVDGGRIDPRINHNDTSMWGQTLGSKVVVARSGIGVTADGALIYVAGPALTAKSLAECLQRAGAVRAMPLDLNPEWVTFLFYAHPDAANPSQVTGSKLYPEIQRPNDRYLSPDSRDFFTVSTR